MTTFEGVVGQTESVYNEYYEYNAQRILFELLSPKKRTSNYSIVYEEN